MQVCKLYEIQLDSTKMQKKCTAIHVFVYIRGGVKCFFTVKSLSSTKLYRVPHSCR